MDNLNELKQELENQIQQQFNANSEKAIELITRLDVRSVLELLSVGQLDDPIGLFWNLYESTSNVSIEWDSLIVRVLDFLYQKHQVPYQPDGEPRNDNDFQFSLDAEQLIIPDKVKGLVRFLHVAAARGFRIKRSQDGQLSEEAINCFMEVVRTNNRLYQAGLGDLIDLDNSLMFLLSADAVAAKASVEIARLRVAEGHYEEALGYLASAAFWSHYSVERYSEQGDDTDYRTESAPVPMAPSCSMTDHIVRNGLDNTSFAEIASTFMKLKEYGRANHWLEVVKDCEHLLYSVYIFGAPVRFPNSSLFRRIDPPTGSHKSTQEAGPCAVYQCLGAPGMSRAFLPQLPFCPKPAGRAGLAVYELRQAKEPCTQVGTTHAGPPRRHPPPRRPG